MDLIAAIIFQRVCSLYEANYLNFILDLKSRFGDEAEEVRPGLSILGRESAANYIQFLQQFTLDLDDLTEDFFSLPEAERPNNFSEFMPTLLIDFDNEQFHSSHPDDIYLKFEGYLPAGWAFQRSDDVRPLLPPEVAYWRDWGI